MIYGKEVLSALALLGSAAIGLVGACPFAAGGKRDIDLPNGHPDIGSDPRHRRLGMGLPSLRGNADASKRIRKLLQERKSERSLQLAGECFTIEIYDAIVEDIKIIYDKMAPVLDARDRGHFFGGIVRLAAHDFMDYDQSDTDFPLGMDGCFDWNVDGSGADNGGLETIWCDDHDVCPLTGLYETVYKGSVTSRADFWVIAANAVVKLASVPWTTTDGQASYENLDLPFRYGRTDREDCSPPTVDSASRLPGAQGCDEVEKTFITQMGLEWRDAVALLGAHTLGYGNSAFSGHDGMWMDEETETVIFNKRYYEEILRRAWRLRNPENDVATENLAAHIGQPKQDWTWAGNNGGNARFMLNADICLAFDIDNLDDSCCTRIRTGGAVAGEIFCVDPRLNLLEEDVVGTINECTSSEFARPDAFNAVNDFAVSIRDDDADENGPFYEAFSAAWQLATEAGYPEGTLRQLSNTCDPTASPTVSPTVSPTASPTATPSASPSAPPTAACEDVSSFIDNNMNSRTCSWVLTDNHDRCKSFAHYCPNTCSECACRKKNRVCTVNEDCCSELCSNDTCICLSKGETCTSSSNCCSGECLGDGKCAGQNAVA